jgi:hypothetical protein
MTREHGHELLNKLQEGQTFDFDQITAALIATGDLAGWREPNMVRFLATGMRSQGLVAPVQDSPARKRDEIGQPLVVANNRENRENPRPWCSAYIAARYEQGQK